MAARKTKLLFVDDHQMILKGILRALEDSNEFNIVLHENCDAAFADIQDSAATDPFDIVFSDLSFDNQNTATVLHDGEALLHAISKTEIPVKTGVITGHSETNRVFNVLKNTAPQAYILKSDCSKEELVFAIFKLMEGKKYYSHEIHQKLQKRALVNIQMDAIALQILRELPKHAKMSNMVGAVTKSDGTPLSLRSIDSRLSILREELGAQNNTDLLLKVKELGLVD